MTISKRLFDILLALLLSLILLPILAVLIVWLLIRQGRPVFHVSERMKTRDQPFNLWKLRTMTVSQADSGVTGGDKSSRITPAGQWLRARRLDELPQLWNILRGDISFVGPRPPLRSYVDRFPQLYAQVLQSRPGVTGLASLYYHAHEARLLDRCKTARETDEIYARICVPAKARLDLIYQRNQSLCWDVLLILKTGKGVLSRR